VGPASPLGGRRVAVTRPDAGALGDELAARGAEVVHVPLIEIADPPDGGMALRAALGRLDAFDWLVVTSANGARAVAAAAAAHPALRLAAVGPATARALAAGAGRDVDVIATLPRVEGLLADLAGLPPSRLLVAQADRAGTALADGLAAADHTVESVVAYTTRPRRPTDDEVARLRTVDAVVFASGSAVEAWASALGTAEPAAVVVVGPVTASVARRLGLTVTAVAAAPGPVGVAAAVVDALP
jgi:uroporphyrinogen-III synthase